MNYELLLNQGALISLQYISSDRLEKDG